MDDDFEEAPKAPKRILTEIELPSGATLPVYAENLGGSKDVDVIDALPLKEVTGVVKEIADAFGKTLENIAPKGASVEFGLKIGVKSGKLISLLAEANGEATLTVTLNWGK